MIERTSAREQEVRRHRGWQFGLRALLLSTLGASSVLGIAVNAYPVVEPSFREMIEEFRDPG